MSGVVERELFLYQEAWQVNDYCMGVAHLSRSARTLITLGRYYQLK